MGSAFHESVRRPNTARRGKRMRTQKGNEIIIHNSIREKGHLADIWCLNFLRDDYALTQISIHTI